jgi:SAM-dependent methyltransferase
MDPKWLANVVHRFQPDGPEPWWHKTRIEIAEAIRRCARPVVLDVGCGCVSGMSISLGGRPGLHLGLDLDPVGRRNVEVGQFVQGSACQIPLAADSVDVLVSGYLLAHLPDPASALREFRRVLKPGGALILWTPNVLNYAMLVSRVTPTWFHNWVRRLGREGECEDNCRTYYRANTPAALERALRLAGLTLVRPVGFGAGAYNYWRFSRPLFLLAVLASRLASMTPLKRLKNTLVVRCAKPVPARSRPPAPGLPARVAAGARPQPAAREEERPLVGSSGERARGGGPGRSA